MANHMKEVANMLGVELGERFNVYCRGKRMGEREYYFGHYGLMYDDGKNNCYCGDELCSILSGEYIIVRKPWKPTSDDGEYYYIEENGGVVSEYWRNDCIDIMFYKLGNCYRTREEAEADRDKWIAFYSSDERIDVFS